MKINKINYQRFNQPDTLIVVSSFPLHGEEIAKRNAVSRYAYLLLKHFPRTQKVIVLCEQVSSWDNQDYLLTDNILVLPSFKFNSLSLLIDLSKKLKFFTQVKNILVQFEFSLFGKELITFFLPFLFLSQRLLGKKVYVMLHQVVLDLATLSGQVKLQTHSLKTKIFNLAMQIFYQTIGLSSNKVLVHDQFLADKLTTLMSKQKVAIIPHGINGFQSFSAVKQVQIKQTLGLKKTDRVLLAYGYHSWYKGTDWLVKNFLRLKQSGCLSEHTKLVLAGDTAPTQKNQPHMRRYYQNLTRLIKQNSDSIVHAGFVPEKEVAKFFAIADLLVFPYRARMSSSGALALALQYRKPFICSNFFIENLLNLPMQNLAKVLNLDLQTLQFKLNYNSFAKAFSNNWRNQSQNKKMFAFAQQIAKDQDWKKVAGQYLLVISSETAQQTIGSVSFSNLVLAESANTQV